MSIITFDTIEYFDDLVAAGVSEAHTAKQTLYLHTKRYANKDRCSY